MAVGYTMSRNWFHPFIGSIIVEERTMKGVRVLMILSLIGTLLAAHASDGHAGGGGRPVYVVLSLPSVLTRRALSLSPPTPPSVP